MSWLDSNQLGINCILNAVFGSRKLLHCHWAIQRFVNLRAGNKLPQSHPRQQMRRTPKCQPPFDNPIGKCSAQYNNNNVYERPHSSIRFHGTRDKMKFTVHRNQPPSFVLLLSVNEGSSRYIATSLLAPLRCKPRFLLRWWPTS